MRAWWMPLLLGVLLVPALAPGPARAQGDWSITRDQKPPARRHPNRGHRGRARHGHRTAPRAGGQGRTEVLIARYRGVLESHPGDSFALRRLLDLYRERDGNIDALVAELEKERASDPEAFGARLLLGQIYELSQRTDEARQAYREAMALRPEAPEPLIALSRIAQSGGDVDRARELLDRALAHTRADAERQDLLRKLGEMALEQKDYDAARGYYERLGRGAKGSIYLRTEYARALGAHGEHERAVREYRRVIAALGGDNRVLPPVLEQLATEQLASGDAHAAVETLEHALRLTSPRSGIRQELYEVMLDAYRADDRLDELATRLEREARGPDAYRLLGRVHDELGHEQQALAAYRKALRGNRRDIDTRVRVIQLLSRSGRLDEVIDAYHELIRIAPREPRFVVELAQLLMQVGKRDEAMRLAARTSRRYPRAAQVHQSLAELYSQWGEQDLATREIKTLVRIDPRDASHLIVLGAQQLADGDRKAAIATWRRILATDPDRAHAQATLGGVFADHDMLEEAEAAYREAVRLEPDELAYVRGLANVLERPREHERSSERRDRQAEAAKLWARVLELAGDDRAARREARDRIVAIAGRSGDLPRRMAQWKQAFAADPPDLAAGRFLAEAYLRQRPRQLADAERVLERLVSLAPGDVDSLTELERVRTARGDLAGAIAVLRKLVDADPRRAPRYLQRMAEHALSLYRDDDAVHYAEMAVQRTPDDAEAHRRLGDLYRARQDVDHAIASYRRAIALNERMFPTYFDLAELYLARGQLDEADQLLRQVMRASPDDDLVARAARASIQIHLGAGTLEALERDLLPLALAHPQRPIYRRLVVELYDAMARPWVREAGQTGPEAEAARAKLAALGKRAIKPLLEALADNDPAQQGIAVALLGHLDNANAAGPLLAAAEGQGPADLRAEALAAAGALAPPDMAGRFVQLAHGSERRLRAMAAWALARMGGRRAVSAMHELLGHPDPAVRAFAALGLGRAGDRASAAPLGALLTNDRNTYVQAAAAWALGQVGTEAVAAELVVALRGSPGLVSRAAARALGRIGGSEARRALAEALFDPEPAQARAAARALAIGQEPSGAPEGQRLPVPDPSVPVGDYLEAWVDRSATEEVGPVDLAPLEDALTQAASDALRGPVERSLAALGALTPQGDGVLGLGPLTEGMADWPPAARRQAAAVLERMAGALADDLAGLIRHPEPRVREQAVRLLARQDGGVAGAALVEALGDDESSVQKAALEAIRAPHARPGGELSARVAELLGHAEWAVRTEAARALGRLGAPSATGALAQALAADPYAFVREAAAGALGRLGGRQAEVALRRARSGDPEPRVRAAARRALSGDTSN